MHIKSGINSNTVWVVIVLFALARLLVAPYFGLGVDEAHYLLYAKHLSLSYFDHPPLVGWLHAPLYYAFGPNEMIARIPAVVLGIGTSYLAYKIVLSVTMNEKAAFWGVAALNSSFIFGALFLMMMPDTVLLFTLMLLIMVFVELLQEQSLKNYLVFGFVLGLCGLSKYTAIIFVVGILAYIIESKKFSILISYKTLFALIVALIVISPVLIWNVQNDFISFKFQSSHVAGGSSFSLLCLVKNLASEFAAYSPPLFLAAFYGLWKSFKSEDIVLRVMFWLGIFILVFFLFTASMKSALPHWISPFFVIFIPMGIALLYTHGSKKVAIYSTLFSLLISFIVYAELLFKLGTFPELKSPFRDIYGWNEACKIAKNLKPISADLAVINWSEGSRVALYSDERVFVADSRRDQFDIWYNQKPIGKDLLFVMTKSSRKALQDECKCDEYIPQGSYDARINGGLVEGFGFELCKNYQGLKK